MSVQTTSTPPCRPIDIVLALERERLAVIRAFEIEATTTVANDPKRAVGLAMLAAELREGFGAGMAPC